MNKALIFVILLAFLGVGAIVLYFTYDNKYMTTLSLYEAQVSKDKIIHDKMWKILQQQAGVSENYAKSFDKIYKNINDARYRTGGEMMKWIQESNPNFDTKLYGTLMESIETYRGEFGKVQERLTDIHRELKIMLTTQPSKFILVTIGGHVLPELNIVTSGRTDDAFTTGKDDDTKLFSSDTVSHK